MAIHLRYSEELLVVEKEGLVERKCQTTTQRKKLRSVLYTALLSQKAMESYLYYTRFIRNVVRGSSAA